MQEVPEKTIVLDIPEVSSPHIDVVLDKLIKVYTSLKDLTPLTYKESQVYKALLVLNATGNNQYLHNKQSEDYISQAALIERRGEVTQYLGKLRDSEWIDYDTKSKTFEIFEPFNNIKLDPNFNIIFELKINLKVLSPLNK